MVASLDCDNFWRNGLGRGRGTSVVPRRNKSASAHLGHALKVDRNHPGRDRIPVHRARLVYELKDRPLPNYGKKERQILLFVGECRIGCEWGSPNRVSFDFEVDLVRQRDLHISYRLDPLEKVVVWRKLVIPLWYHLRSSYWMTYLASSIPWYHFECLELVVAR